MPHAMRVEFPGAIYPVVDRGDRREDILIYAMAQVSAVLGWPSEACTSSLADLMTRSTFRLAWLGVRSAWLGGFLLLAASTAVSGGAELKPQLGPVEEGVLLDDFTMESQTAWKPTAGSNVGYKLEAGRNIPGVASSLMQIELSRKDPTDTAPGHNWFSMKRSLPAGLIKGDAKGIRLVMGSQPAAQWWLNVGRRVARIR